MRSRVYAFPNQVTSIRRTPMAAKVSEPAATRTSRASTATANHVGTDPSIMMPPTPTKNRSRSATGSSTLPSVRHLVEVAGDVAVEEVGDAEHGEERRGRGPVLLDEEEPQEHRQQRQSRTAVMTFGTVRIRSVS